MRQRCAWADKGAPGQVVEAGELAVQLSAVSLTEEQRREDGRRAGESGTGRTVCGRREGGGGDGEQRAMNERNGH